jgi:serine/threonine-protein phosphatase 2B catalytic subunit
MIKVPEPVIIVGDLHGQLYDLVTLLDKNPDPSTVNYVFLGDYVDRGVLGVEVVLLLLSLKV